MTTPANRRTAARHALAIAAAADAIAALALILASLTGESARSLTPQLIVFGVLNALIPLALIGDARIRERRHTGPQQWIDDQHIHHDNGI